jgi:hypothetical protein
MAFKQLTERMSMIAKDQPAQDIIREFISSQYRNTAAVLREKDIVDNVTLYRGMNFAFDTDKPAFFDQLVSDQKLLVRDLQVKTKQIGQAVGFGEITREEGQARIIQYTAEIVDRAREVGTVNLSLQPLSSFSSDLGTTQSFAQHDTGMVIAADFPVSQIISTTRTGNGALPEYEVVTLGSAGQAFAMWQNLIAAIADAGRAFS